MYCFWSWAGWVDGEPGGGSQRRTVAEAKADKLEEDESSPIVWLSGSQGDSRPTASTLCAMTGPRWTEMRALTRHQAASLWGSDVPTAVGVYAWLRDDSPIYSGRGHRRGAAVPFRERVLLHALVEHPSRGLPDWQRDSEACAEFQRGPVGVVEDSGYVVLGDVEIDTAR